ncbi:MAG: hypothetical protein ACYCXQ_13260 [Candidatus Humimicrobiaceae bacterium]
MNNKNNSIRYLLIILSVIIFMCLMSCNIINFFGSASSTVTSPAATTTAGTIKEGAADTLAQEEKKQLSQQPNEIAFKEYFSELGLGKLPENGSLPLDLKKGDNVFISNGKDHLVIYGNLLKDAKFSNGIYDVNAGKNIRGKAEFPMIIKKGGFAGSEPVNIPSGLYEYKIWIGDKLVGVFPFEVKP